MRESKEAIKLGKTGAQERFDKAYKGFKEAQNALRNHLKASVQAAQKDKKDVLAKKEVKKSVPIEPVVQDDAGQTHRHAKQEAKKIAELIVVALKESGHIAVKCKDYVQHYPAFTVHNILLSFLYQKITVVKELTAYFDQFKPSILKPNAPFVAFDPKRTFTMLEAEFGKRPYDAKQAYINEHYEEIAYRAIYEAKCEGCMPPLTRAVGMGEFKRIRFPSCGEDAMLNFTKFLMVTMGLYDQDVHCFKADKIASALCQQYQKKKVKYDEKVVAQHVQSVTQFFTKFNDALVPYAALGDWANLVSNLSGVKYTKKYDAAMNPKEGFDLCVHPKPDEKYENAIVCGPEFNLVNMAGYPSSYVNVTNHLFGTAFKTFKELCNFFDITGDDLESFTDAKMYHNIYKDRLPNPVRMLTGLVGDKIISIQVQGGAGHINVIDKTSLDISQTLKILKFAQYYFYISINQNIALACRHLTKNKDDWFDSAWTWKHCIPLVIHCMFQHDWFAKDQDMNDFVDKNMARLERALNYSSIATDDFDRLEARMILDELKKVCSATPSGLQSWFCSTKKFQQQKQQKKDEIYTRLLRVLWKIKS